MQVGIPVLLLCISSPSWSGSMPVFQSVNGFPIDRFNSNTKQNGAGDPEEGNKFKIATEARYYLEGAVEYLDAEGEYFVSVGENIEDSKGWTLCYPPSDLKDTDFTTVLSLSGEFLFGKDVGEDMFVTVENLHFEASKRLLGAVLQTVSLSMPVMME